MGRHRRGARVPAQRRRLGITDAQTRVEHVVSDESVAEHRHSGRYLALCGARVLAASLTARARARCQACWGGTK